MNKKVIAIVAAGVLALMGVAVVAMWAKQADTRAYAGAKLVSVVRVTSEVPVGTKAADLVASTEVVKVPGSTVPQGAVRDLGSVAGRVTSADLVPGEVLLDSRLVDPSSKAAAVSGVPRGMQEISLSLETARVAGGKLKPGDTVGVIVSFQDGTSTKTLLNRVVVTQADFSKVGEGAQTTATISLAVSAKDAEKVANAAEFGKIWLTKQNAASDVGGTSSVSSKELAR